MRQIPPEITGAVPAPRLAAVLTAPQRPVALVDEAVHRALDLTGHDLMALSRTLATELGIVIE